MIKNRTFQAFIGLCLATWPNLAVAGGVGGGGPVPYSAALAVALMAVEPAKAGAASHSAVAPSVQLVIRGKLAAACRDADRRFRALQVDGSRLFFGPDRRKAELSRIELFLDRNVRAKAPALELMDESFAPAPAWRAVVAGACMQSDQPAIAVRMLAAVASHAPASLVAGRFAVALAAQERDWSKGVAAAGANQTLPALLLRALAEPHFAESTLVAAAKAAATDRELAAVSAVRRHLGR